MVCAKPINNPKGLQLLLCTHKPYRLRLGCTNACREDLFTVKWRKLFTWKIASTVKRNICSIVTSRKVESSKQIYNTDGYYSIINSILQKGKKMQPFFANSELFTNKKMDRLQPVKWLFLICCMLCRIIADD